MGLRRSPLGSLAFRRSAVAAILLGTLGLALWQARATGVDVVAGSSGQGPDVALYDAVRLRLVAGEAYYASLATELVAHHFPTWPSFHWRMPVLLPLLAALPWPWGAQAIQLAGLSIAAAALVRGAPPSAMSVAVGSLTALAAPLILLKSGLLFGECWAAVGIAISAAGLVVDRPVLRVGGAVWALAFRELAVLWWVVVLLDALANGRRREVALLGAAGVVFALGYGLHVSAVLAVLPADPQSRGSIGLGGPLHALRCLGWYPLAVVFRPLAPVFVGAAASAALFPPGDRPGVRVVALGALAYLASFTVFGLAFNAYWGVLLCGLWGIVLPFGATGAWHAWQRTR